MAKPGNGATADPPPPPDPAASPPDPLELKERLDRYGEILVKGLDLAEAGLSLGLMVIGKVGAAAQEKIIERFMDAVTPAPVAASAAPSPTTAPPQAAAAPMPTAETAPAPAYGITNRLPLVPGAPFSVSFSINNDSPLAAKQVALSVEPFTGERTGAALRSSALAVSPITAAIAPMDFEKFVLHGAIPLETPPDAYHGAVSIGPESGIRIPVRLVIEPSGGN